MVQLVPHLLLRTNADKSEAAVALRDGGYLVSRVADEAAAAELAGYPHVDAIVVDLPLFAAIGFANAVLATGLQIPMLILSSNPEIMRRAIRGAVTIGSMVDIVSGVDLMLARFSGYEASSNKMALVPLSYYEAARPKRASQTVSVSDH